MVCSFNDIGEFINLQTGTSDQEPVNVLPTQQIPGISDIGRASIEDADRIGSLLSVESADL